MPQANSPAKLSVDFTGVSVGGGGSSDRVPEGDYLAEVHDYRVGPTKKDPSIDMITWTLKIVEPAKYAGKTIISRNVLSKESLWSLRAFLVSMLGEDKIPASSLSVPLAAIKAKRKKVGLTLIDDEPYNNKIKSKIADTFPVSDWADRQSTASGDDIDDDDEDAPAAKAADVTASDDDEDLDEIDVDDI